MKKMHTISLLLLLLSGACKKGFESINTNPGQFPEGEMNFNYLFTNAQLQTSGNSDGNGYEDWRNNLIYSACMVQHLSSTLSYWDGDKYLYSAPYNSAYWDENYPKAIANIVAVTEHVRSDTTQFNFYQIARIFKVFIFQRMTDMYGDCPYSQAGKGYIDSILTPVYDKQESIYYDMLFELKDAAAKLDAIRPNTVGAADLLYAGDPTQWKKFAYSEMVRLAMRLCKVAPDSAAKWVQIAAQASVMQTSTDNAVLYHEAVTSTSDVNGSGLVLTATDPNGYRMAKTFIDFLRNSGDPRLPYLSTVCTDPNQSADKGDTASAHQMGQPNGYNPPNSDTNTIYDLTKAPGWPGNQNKYSIVNRYTFARLDAPTFFLTAGETQLLLAEAAWRGFIPDDPAAHYNTAMTAAMQQLRTQAGAGPADSLIAGWLAIHPFDATNALQQINDQYWVAGFMDENECFANWRRSGYPQLTPVNYPGNITGGTIPRRFTYPQSEASANTANYNAAVSRLSNGDKMTSRIWWDK